MQISRRDFGADDENVKQVPLPDGTMTTLSEEQVVLEQLRLARVGRGMRVLEVGCGTGYLCAHLVQAVGRGDLVYGNDILPQAVELARANLNRIGIDGVRLFTGNGLEGVEESRTRFDRIIVSCAVREFPWRLVEQLSPGGVMVLPLERGWTLLFDGVLLSVLRVDERVALVPLEMASGIFMIAEGTVPAVPLSRIEVPPLLEGFDNHLLMYKHSAEEIGCPPDARWQEVPVDGQQPFPGGALRQIALLLSVLCPERTCFLVPSHQPGYMGVGVWQSWPFGVAIATFSQSGMDFLGEVYTLGDRSIATELLTVVERAKLPPAERLNHTRREWTPEQGWRVATT